MRVTWDICDIDSLIDSLKEALRSLFTWSDNTLMKSIADKCNLVVCSNEKVTVKRCSHEFANTKLEKLLVVDLGNELSDLQKSKS